MKGVIDYLVAVDNTEYTGKSDCFMSLDNILQDLIKNLTHEGYRTSGDLLELKNCSWVLHERYFEEDEQKFKWIFYNTKYRILRSCINIINSSMARERMETKDEADRKVA